MAAKTDSPSVNGAIVIDWSELDIKVGGRSGRKGGELVPVKELVGETIVVTGLRERTRKGEVTGYTAEVVTAEGEHLLVKLTDRLEDAMLQAFRARPDAHFRVRVTTTGKTGRTITFAS
jgi:hypothetical protein